MASPIPRLLCVLIASHLLEKVFENKINKTKYKTNDPQVLAHGTVDALYHAFRPVTVARDGVQDPSNQSDSEEIVEVLALAEEIVQDMLDRGFGQATAQTFNVTQTRISKFDPVRDVPEV